MYIGLEVGVGGYRMILKVMIELDKVEKEFGFS